MLGGHVRAVFTLVTVIFIVCVTATVTSFREIPLWRLEATNAEHQQYTAINGDHRQLDENAKTSTYGSVNKPDVIVQETPMVNILIQLLTFIIC